MNDFNDIKRFLESRFVNAKFTDVPRYETMTKEFREGKWTVTGGETHDRKLIFTASPMDMYSLVFQFDENDRLMHISHQGPNY